MAPSDEPARYPGRVLPRKGSRRVVVDGVTYRWREGHGAREFEVRLERFEAPGQLLVARFPYRHLDPQRPARVYRPVMTRRLLASLVEAALAEGWTPAARGPLWTLSPERAASLVGDYDYRYSKWTVRLADGRYR